MDRSPIPTRAPRSPDAAPDDAALLARSNVDPVTFELVYARHHDAVFGYLAARVGSANADDLVAETFLAAFASRDRFRPELGRDARPWLLGIATRRLGRHRDAERRWLRDGAAVTVDAPASEGERDVDARLDAARVAPELATALAQLRPRERDPLLLHVICGLTYEEVGAALGLPLGTVQSRISRARTRLAGILDGVAR
jgi:RNA polymerase sigma-70 factor (ECF subfamily)